MELRRLLRDAAPEEADGDQGGGGEFEAVDVVVPVDDEGAADEGRGDDDRLELAPLVAERDGRAVDGEEVAPVEEERRQAQEPGRPRRELGTDGSREGGRRRTDAGRRYDRKGRREERPAADPQVVDAVLEQDLSASAGGTGRRRPRGRTPGGRTRDICSGYACFSYDFKSWSWAPSTRGTRGPARLGPRARGAGRLAEDAVEDDAKVSVAGRGGPDDAVGGLTGRGGPTVRGGATRARHSRAVGPGRIRRRAGRRSTRRGPPTATPSRLDGWGSPPPHDEKNIRGRQS